MSITRINEFQAAEGRAEELYSFLKSLVPYISSSAGCGGCEVLRRKDRKDDFVVIERWDSVESHRKSIDHFPKDEMLAATPLFGAPPKGNYYES